MYPPLDPGIDDAPNPDEAYIASERAELLRGMIYKLPLKTRELLLLRFFADASMEEIATVQKCSIGTIKSRLFYGLEKLRKMTLTELR
ncbi:MAG TPA: sigma-70 family RNA polymerase sigma factor [Verrucomicrobiales bacterium]|nr:sigma-70 family RNA polymerase sigma factor [Verrucomicrobiales bacterium]HIL70852.1 sigma-70 family RNA polymerase sigma factor [Verrucomicrobiota bacterium]